MSWNTSDRRRRLPADWDRRRKLILNRDPICRHCRKAKATEVDHIRPGDDHSLSNLQGLCRDCHTRKTQAEKPRPESKYRKPEPHPGLTR